MMKALGLGVILLLAGVGPASAGQKKDTGTAGGEKEFTLGLVQKELRIGMSQADIVGVIGSPNILTRDSQGHEAWVYDKIASEAQWKSSGFRAGGGGMGAVGSTVLLGMLSGHNSNDKSTTSQRTLTVVIRFDTDGRVESFSFHATRF